MKISTYLSERPDLKVAATLRANGIDGAFVTPTKISDTDVRVVISVGRAIKASEWEFFASAAEGAGFVVCDFIRKNHAVGAKFFPAK